MSSPSYHISTDKHLEPFIGISIRSPKSTDSRNVSSILSDSDVTSPIYRNKKVVLSFVPKVEELETFIFETLKEEKKWKDRETLPPPPPICCQPNFGSIGDSLNKLISLDNKNENIEGRYIPIKCRERGKNTEFEYFIYNSYKNGIWVFTTRLGKILYAYKITKSEK